MPPVGGGGEPPAAPAITRKIGWSDSGTAAVVPAASAVVVDAVPLPNGSTSEIAVMDGTVTVAVVVGLLIGVPALLPFEAFHVYGSGQIASTQVPSDFCISSE